MRRDLLPTFFGPEFVSSNNNLFCLLSVSLLLLSLKFSVQVLSPDSESAHSADSADSY